MAIRTLSGESPAGSRDAQDDFDPVAEGARSQLTPEASRALWVYVSGQLASYGSRDERLNRQCFREAASRIAARGGELSAALLGSGIARTAVDPAAKR